MHIKHKNRRRKNIFLTENTREKNLQNILSLYLDQRSVKPRKLLLTSFWRTISSLSCETAWVSEEKWKGLSPYLYSSIELTYKLVRMNSLAARSNMSNWTLQIAILYRHLGTIDVTYTRRFTLHPSMNLTRQNSSPQGGIQYNYNIFQSFIILAL